MPLRHYTSVVAPLVLLFIVVPLVEIWLLLLIGTHIGVWPTIGLTVVTAVVGGRLASLEGRRVLGQWNEALVAGRVPEEGILSGVLIFVGGLLLLTPGVVTDVTGLALLFPPTRRLIAAFVRPRLSRLVASGSGAHQRNAGAFFWSVRVTDAGRTANARRPPSRPPDVIDVDGEGRDEPPPRLPRG